MELHVANSITQDCKGYIWLHMVALGYAGLHGTTQGYIIMIKLHRLGLYGVTGILGLARLHRVIYCTTQN